MTDQRLARRTVASYATGSLGTAGFSTLPGLVLVYYLTDMLAVSALAAGAIVAVAKVWDVIIDPVIGAASDRDAARTGSRRRFMVVGALVLPVFFVLTFAAPAALPAWPIAVWVGAAYLLAATAFSVFQVPYIALPAELTDSYDERTRLLTVRVVVLTIGILAFGGGGPALRELGSSKLIGYLIMAVVAAVILGISLYIAAGSTRAARTPHPTTGSSTALVETAKASYRQSISILRRSHPLRVLLGAFMLQGLATGLMLAGGQYIATWVLDDESLVTVLFIALIAPALLCAPLWGRLANRISKKAGFLYATAVFIVASAGLVVLNWAPGWWVYPVIGLTGAAYAGMQSLPMAMLPDVISHDEREQDGSSAGAIGGVWTAGETTGMALGAVVFAMLLGIGGYISSDTDAAITQPGSATTAMVLGFSVVPSLLALVSVWLICRYPLSRNDTEMDAAIIEQEDRGVA